MLAQLKERKVLRRRFDRGLERSVERSVESYKPTIGSASVPMGLSDDVMVMAQTIATEWGLKTPRDAVEAVFRKYANEYMYGRQNAGKADNFMGSVMPIGLPNVNRATQDEVQCEAMNELDGLLGL
jgi:hypothetical protein